MILQIMSVAGAPAPTRIPSGPSQSAGGGEIRLEYELSVALRDRLSMFRRKNHSEGMTKLALALALMCAGVGGSMEKHEMEPHGSGFALPPFQEAMGNRPIQWGWWSSDDRSWMSLFERLYEKNLRIPAAEGNGSGRELGTKSEEEEGNLGGIPKILHQVWLGGTPLPEQFEVWRQTWLDAHPDWVHLLWTEDEANELPMVDRAVYDSAQNVGAKSDVLRREAVYRFGGLYVDIDFECLASFDGLVSSLDFFASLSNVGSIEISNGIFAASKRHPILHRLLTTPPEALPPPGGASQLDWVGMPTIVTSGPGHFTRVVMACLLEATSEGLGGISREPIGRTVILPTMMVFPLPNSVVSSKRKEREESRHASVRPESLAIHHWASSWLKHEVGAEAWGFPPEAPTRKEL